MREQTMYGLDGGKLQVLRPAADTKYPLRAGGTAAALNGKTRFLPYYICIIIYMSAAAKGSAAFRPYPRPAGDGTDAAREAAETVPRGIGTRSAARCTGHAQAG